jgi:hypothetical protein
MQENKVLMVAAWLQRQQIAPALASLAHMICPNHRSPQIRIKIYHSASISQLAQAFKILK